MVMRMTPVVIVIVRVASGSGGEASGDEGSECCAIHFAEWQALFIGHTGTVFNLRCKHLISRTAPAELADNRSPAGFDGVRLTSAD